MPVKPFTGQSPTGLGLGSDLSNQVQDETEEEKRRKRLGLSQASNPAVTSLLGVGGMAR
jgi:hypothetical protein